MDQILLELVRYVITLPADASIAWRFALLVVVVVGVWATARERRLWLESHQRFIDRATPEQLDAYKANPQIHKAKHKQLAPPSNGGPLVLVLAFCALGLSGEHVSYAVSRDEYATNAKPKCKPACEAPSVCRNGSCVAPAIAPPPAPKPLPSPTSGLDPWAYDPRPPQLRIPNS
jgi:hypothetical protein